MTKWLKSTILKTAYARCGKHCRIFPDLLHFFKLSRILLLYVFNRKCGIGFGPKREYNHLNKVE